MKHLVSHWPRLRILIIYSVYFRFTTSLRKVSYPCLSMPEKPTKVESFTVVTADNIDYLHSYARVCKHNQKSSWHGTSVQLVQPRPSLSLATVSMHTSLRNGSQGIQTSTKHEKLKNVSIKEFIQVNQEELDAMHETQTSLNMYIVQRTALANKEPTKFLLNMQEYLRVTTATHTEK